MSSTDTLIVSKPCSNYRLQGCWLSSQSMLVFYSWKWSPPSDLEYPFRPTYSTAGASSLRKRFGNNSLALDKSIFCFSWSSSIAGFSSSGLSGGIAPFSASMSSMKSPLVYSESKLSRTAAECIYEGIWTFYIQKPHSFLKNEVPLGSKAYIGLRKL